MQEAINAWSMGLRTTGGALVPQKCWVYPIQFQFDSHGQYSYSPTEDLQLHLTVPDDTQRLHPLLQVEPTIAKETLGVYLAPDGNEDAQIEYLKQRIAQWVENVRTNHIAKHHAMLALNTTIYKTLEYPVPSLTITSRQWRSIMAPLTQCGLQSNGVCSKLPRVIREGSTNHMSLNIKCMFKVQEIKKLEKYLFFRNHSGLVGQMLRLNEELLVLEVGLPGNIYESDYTTFQHLATPSWIKTMWKFLHTHQITIPMTSKALAATKTNDTFLILAFHQQGYKNSKLTTLNICRKYLQVVTLGDITSANGSLILPNVKAGIRDTTSSSLYEWPDQAKPHPKAWALWRQALKQTFECQGTVLPRFLTNTWSSNPARKFQWYFHPTHNILLQSIHHTPTALLSDEDDDHSCGPSIEHKLFSIHSQILLRPPLLYKQLLT